MTSGAAAPSAEPATPSSAESRWNRRRLGYFTWLIAHGFFAIPEILAASSRIEKHLPFTTFSGMVAHLEYLYPAVEIATTAVLVFVIASIVRVSPRSYSGARKGLREDGK